jgi:hypothetical protein
MNNVMDLSFLGTKEKNTVPARVDIDSSSSKFKSSPNPHYLKISKKTWLISLEISKTMHLLF